VEVFSICLYPLHTPQYAGEPHRAHNSDTCGVMVAGPHHCIHISCITAHIRARCSCRARAHTQRTDIHVSRRLHNPSSTPPKARIRLLMRAALIALVTLFAALNSTAPLPARRARGVLLHALWHTGGARPSLNLVPASDESEVVSDPPLNLKLQAPSADTPTLSLAGWLSARTLLCPSPRRGQCLPQPIF